MIQSPTFPYYLERTERPRLAGELDVGYGVAGRASGEYPHFGSVGSESIAYASTVDRQGRLIVAGHSFDGRGTLVASVLRLCPNGTPDPDFGLRGFVTLPAHIDSGEAWLRCVVAEPDGSLIVGFDVKGNLRRHVSLLRLLPCGSTDLAYLQRSEGALWFAPKSIIDTLHGLQLREDGSLLVLAGTHLDRVSEPRLAVACLDADGRLQRGYGDDAIAPGIACVPLPEPLRRRQAWMFAPAPDGDLLCAGDVCEGDDALPVGMAVCRLDATGRVVNTFGQAGTLHLRSPDEDATRAIACRADGRIVLTVQTGGSGFVAVPKVLQFHPDGRPDRNFGRSGSAIAHLGGPARYQRPQVACLQRDGCLLVAGTPWADVGGQRAILSRLLPDGALDTDFGENGLLRCGFAHEFGRSDAINVDTICGIHVAGERILLAGHLLEYEMKYRLCALAAHC